MKLKVIGVVLCMVSAIYLLAGPAPTSGSGLPGALSVDGASQTWDEIVKLTASDTAEGDQFGISVSVSNSSAVIGACFNDDAGDRSGSAYILHRDQGGVENWGEVIKLIPSDSAAGDWFGWSVAMDGTTAAIGARRSDGLGTDSGAAYIFERDQGGMNNWGQAKKLTAADGADFDQFGYSVAMSGDTVVVGAHGHDGESGAVYIFERDEGGVNNWGEVAKRATAIPTDWFGWSVAISGDLAVVGTPRGDTDDAPNAGHTYVFERNEGGDGNWGQICDIVASDADEEDRLGFFVSISGRTIAIGAPGDDDGVIASGSAYVFKVNDAGSCTQVKKLIASDAGVGDRFGTSTAVDGGIVVVGSVFDDFGTIGGAGSAYVFDRDAGGQDNWGEVAKLVASNPVSSANFGDYVAISNGSVLVGAPGDDGPGNFAGSAYVFQRPPLFSDGFESGDTSAWSSVQP